MTKKEENCQKCMSFWQKGVNFAYFNQINTCKSQIVMHLDLYEYIRVFILKCTESNLCWFVENWYACTTIMYICTHFKIPAYVFMSTIYISMCMEITWYTCSYTVNVKRKKNGYLRNVSMPKSCSYKEGISL